MSSSEPPLYCINPACESPRNAIGGQVCANCHTPLVYRYLWALGEMAAQVSVGELINGRYWVVAPQIWQDTQPAELPYVPPMLPDEILPYLYLYPHRLHIPEVYGFVLVGEGEESSEITLLENVPVDAVGNLYPSITEAWPTASAVRQLYWLWQMIELWNPLEQAGVVDSLLAWETIRVEGWRIWLQELSGVGVNGAGTQKKTHIRLKELGYHWLGWVSGAQPAIADDLKEICHQMRRGDATVESVSTQFNQLLLEQAAKLPLRVKVYGASDTGPIRDHNEDSCYPTLIELKNRTQLPHHQLIPYFSVVCDGVGGHEGGEVASQSAVMSFKPLIQTLIADTAEATEITPVEVVTQQLEESLRVINNTIAAQNDTQGRSSRQRMGTTAVMALQLPQKVRFADGGEYGNAHELYIAHVGDSRAYWITSDYCQRLTVDDDVSSREVRLGRALYREALLRPDAGALTQALGTRDGEFIRPNIQRFIVEEDGLLLLCSDGLCDNDLVELTWADYAPAVLKGDMPLEAATETLIKLANEKNGHDNTSVVLTHYRLTPEPLVLFEPKQQALNQEQPLESELSEASKALLYDEPEAPAETSTMPATPPPLKRPQKGLSQVLAILGVALIAGTIGLIGWAQLDPQGFAALRNLIFPGGEPENEPVSPTATPNTNLEEVPLEPAPTANPDGSIPLTPDSDPDTLPSEATPSPGPVETTP
jgi:protein phosphatase